MKILKNTSLLFMLIGILVFTITFTLGQYKLTNTILKQSVSSTHYEQLHPELKFMLNQTYSSNLKFIRDVKNTIEILNKEYQKSQQWDKIIWTDYTFILTKNASSEVFLKHKLLWFLLSIGVFFIGALIYIVVKYGKGLPWIKNNHIYSKSLTSRGYIGIILGTLIIGFYILLYWFPAYITSWIGLFDPLSRILNGNSASQWFFYGALYTLGVLVMGVRMILKYRHNKYQIYRSVSVMFFQLCFAFLIPEILVSLNKPWYDFKNIWPLDYDFFFSWNWDQMIASGGLGLFMLVWGIVLFAIIVPVFTYFFGKRWYCSWVCGCGGLAETVGDPFRQLSDKSLKSWKVERWIVHSVLLIAVMMTIVTLINYLSNFQLLGNATNTLQVWYGRLIGAAFAGVIGTGFYPLMGNRVWCRFGCPLAAYLGIVQRFKSRFRITTNGGQCISCGNCSTYCEMGIDVRAYAQNGKNVVRASCVGCGICAAVCPRGVLKLENKNVKDRINSNKRLIDIVG